MALRYNTTGFHNTAIGQVALYSNTTGCNNTAIGNAALQSNTTGFHNTAIGERALRNNTSGSFNIAIGNCALIANTTGSHNIALGYRAESGDFSYSVILGKDATATSNCQFIVGSVGTPVGTVVTASCSSTKYWEVMINGVLQKILLA